MAEEYRTIDAEELKSILLGEKPGYLRNKAYLASIGLDYDAAFVIEDVKVDTLIFYSQHKGRIAKYNLPIVFLSGEFNKIYIEGGDFQDIIIKGGTYKELFKIGNGNFNGMIEIAGGDFLGDFYIFDGTFNSYFNISGGNFHKELSIRNGDFKKALQVTRGNFESLFTVEGGKFNRFSIAGGNYKDSLRILNGDFNNVFIADAVFERLTYINGGNFTFFNIRSGEFKYGFIVDGGSFNNVYLITGGQFLNPFLIRGGEFKMGFQIIGGYFKTVFNISGGNFHDNLIIRGGVFNGWVQIKKGYFKSDLEINGGYFFGCLEIDNAFFQNILISFSQLKINYLVFRGITSAKSISLKLPYRHSKSELRHLMFCDVNILTGVLLEIEGLIINNLYFSGVLNFSNVVLTGVRFINSIEYRNMQEEEGYVENFFDTDIGIEFPAHTLIQPDTLQIFDSDLGKTTFIDCDLSGMSLNFRSSKITDVFLAGTRMPEEIITDDNKQKQLGYAQLKKVYENRGDFLTARNYFAHEMNTYYNQLFYYIT